MELIPTRHLIICLGQHRSPGVLEMDTYEWWFGPLAALLAYLAGSLSFAVIVSRLMHLDDPRSYGSGNPGATNVLRSGNKTAAALTLLFDGLKAFIPLWCVQQYGAEFGLSGGTVAAVALAAFLGHLFPVFFKFKGGKGVATAIGASFGIHPLLGVATGLTWLIIAYFFRYSSLAALVAAVFTPVYYLLCDGVAWRSEPEVTVTLGLIAGLLLWRHRANIARLISGSEPRIGAKS
jgi:glycerol-3-phosphate acyltransferase PlsY